MGGSQCLLLQTRGYIGRGPGRPQSSMLTLLRPKTREYQLYQLKPTAPDPGQDVRIDMASEV